MKKQESVGSLNDCFHNFDRITSILRFVGLELKHHSDITQNNDTVNIYNKNN